MASNPPAQDSATPRPTVFVSYAHQDADFANRLIANLDTAGRACWIDTSSIKGGDEWMITIAEGISDSYAFIVIVTRSALESRWVRDEILWARNESKPIIPLIREDVFRDKRFFLLNSYQGVTLLDGNYDAALPKLLRSLPTPTFPAAGIDQPRKVELAYLNRLRFEELLNAEKYTPMGGSSEQRLSRVEMRAVFELLRMSKDRRLHTEPKRFENAVEEIRRIRRAVLLGEPGGGKTTTIWKLAAELVAEAAQDREAPIPLLIRLGRWTDADQPLSDFIASQLGDLGASLDLLLAEDRAALLLDGLNELPAGQRDIKYPQVRRLIEQHPALLAVVSCRELDYTDDLGFDRVNITPLDPIRIREFARRYLDASRGDELFWKLAGQAARDMRDRFMQGFEKKLVEPERVFWLEPQLPAGTYWGWWGDDNRHWENWLKIREAPSSLMVLARNPYMLLMLTSVFAEQGELPENRGELFGLFVETLLKRERIPEDEQTPLTDGLAKVAYEMQIRRAEGDAGDALTVLSKDAVNAILGERLLYLAGSASILSVGEQVRFTHQLLQEYFAAKFMDIEIRAGRIEASSIWPPDRWWERTNWEEAAILLAGLYSDDCSRVVEWVAEANPEVAAQCVARSGVGNTLSKAARERLRKEWIDRLTDLDRDPKPQARAAIGRALGLTRWDNRRGVGIGRDANGVTLPDIVWEVIPGGEFQYGDESEWAAKPQKLTLPTFHISRYPVTYAQFQTFLDDPEGFDDPRWFDGLAASDDERRMEEQYFKFANHPRECVNWYQAMAFCRWLSWRLGGEYDLKKVAEWAVRLPTEFEWEKAARGTDGRIYPYKGDYDAVKGNTDNTIGQTSAVGAFPNGASPYGVMDMSGNVWEWCLSSYQKPAIDVRKENVRTDDIRVLRGGAWFNAHLDARAVSRNNLIAADRDYFIGFRLVRVVRPPSLLL
jgi:formylglycine-generating enzyme required for sulfatase activity